MLVEAFGSARALEGPGALTSRAHQCARDGHLKFGAQDHIARPACHGQSLVERGREETSTAWGAVLRGQCVGGDRTSSLLSQLHPLTV